MPKVVLVDDEIWVQRNLQALLREYPSYEIVAAFLDGREALNYLRTHPCDILFTDLRMSPMSGRQLISACHSEGIPVCMVIISAYSDFEAAREGLQSGVLDYLLKPLTREAIAALIQRLDAHFVQSASHLPFIAQRRQVELAYGECRVLCCPAEHRAALDALKEVPQASFSLCLDEMMMNGYRLALLSNPPGHVPAAIEALPPQVGISRHQENFSSFDDMLAEAQISSLAAFRFSENDTIAAIQAYLAQNYAKPLSLDDLAAQFFMSKAHLCTLFRNVYGTTIMSFLKNIRIQIAIHLLTQTDETIQNIGVQVGYPGSAYFSRVFKNTCGISPEMYKKNWQTGSEA